MSELNVTEASRIWNELAKPFHPNDLEWRPQSAKEGKRGRPWIRALVYVDNRAIMDRLDTVLGPPGWQNNFNAGPDGVICNLGILTPNGWIWKSDGAGYTDVESFKGGISGAMKRAAVQYQMGRYLYNIESSFGIVHDLGRFAGKTTDTKVDFRWSPPELPKFALPAGVPTREEGLAYLKEHFNEIPEDAQVQVAGEYYEIPSLLKEFTPDSPLKKDHLLVLDLVEAVQALL